MINRECEISHQPAQLQRRDIQSRYLFAMCYHVSEYELLLFEWEIMSKIGKIAESSTWIVYPQAGLNKCSSIVHRKY